MEFNKQIVYSIADVDLMLRSIEFDRSKIEIREFDRFHCSLGSPLVIAEYWSTDRIYHSRN